ncbi:MAG: acetyl-CoA C-acetyltransferase [Mycolicibacterium neoaurum]|uniref:acetyl-CoA C-acetyltransferase n=1 Tax=Mycolicibacterium neoaurum TaxID=1795 RepID=UPI002FF57D62
MTSGTSVLVAGARTPIGRFMGSLSSMSAAELGGTAIAGALAKAGITGTQVQYVIMGQVLTAGAGQLPARQAAVAGGIPMTVPALTVNKVCLSGIDSIILADQMIRCGSAEIVVAGGQESMSQAPHLLPKSRAGYKYGDVAVTDHLAFDGLRDVFTDEAMGALTEDANDLDRAAQDAFAARSHTRAATAWKDGLFADEVVPVQVSGRRGESLPFDHDESIRADTTIESLARLRPAFRPDGNVTAGNASPINDGAAAVVVMSRRKAEELGVGWIAEIGAHGMVAGPDSTLQLQPANAIAAACARSELAPAALDLVEINEAFAAVGIASAAALGLDEDRVNVNGGAIALGHPLGTSGTRITLHLALELRRRGGGNGAAALCGGGGQGTALLLHCRP